MNIVNFTPVPSFIGGILIGISAVALLYFNGKIAGISGITKGTFNFKERDTLWRILFFIGLVIGGLFSTRFFESAISNVDQLQINTKLIIAAVAVGIGTAYGNGCTSGHGICGLARKSKRSVTATLIFMATGFITVFLEKLI